MPLDVADYLSDTGHLTTVQHGAYLLLIMHYWKRGSLPEADDQLAAITRMTPAGWKLAKPTIQGFFRDGWKHERIEKEIAKAARISSKRSDAALQMHGMKDASAGQKHTHLTLTSTPNSLKNYKNLGEAKSKPSSGGWSPPKHGASGKGRVYLLADTDEWKAYAVDYREVHGADPKPNQHGGKWFKVMGEASPDPQQLRAMR